MDLLSKSQVSWLEMLYNANAQMRGSISVPPRIFETLKTMKYVTGDTNAAAITPEGTSALLRYRREE